VNIIILLRHGETHTNVKNVLPKFNDPDNLTEVGIRQIELASKHLKGLGLNVLYASNKNRALQSAEIVGNICNLEVQILEGMEERNWGDYSGKSWSEIKSILDPLTLEERYNYTPPKGESWRIFEQRLITAIKNINSINHDKVICVVTHGGSIRALIPFLLNIPKEESFKYDPKNSSISIFEFNGENMKALTIDNIEHLTSLTQKK
jgi:broad specificity phosphatase PhoE